MKKIIKIKKSINIIVNFIIFIEIVLLFIFIGLKFTGIKTYVITSGSMEPIYPIGSLIIVKATEPENIKKNDVITFYILDTDIVATHQVYEIDFDKRQFKTQGINNFDDNGNIIQDSLPVNFSSLIGKCIFCIPYLGYIYKNLNLYIGLFIIFVLIIISKLLKMEEKSNESKKIKKE